MGHKSKYMQNDTSINDNNLVAEAFANYFSKIVPKVADNIASLPGDSTNNFGLLGR